MRIKAFNLPEASMHTDFTNWITNTARPYLFGKSVVCCGQRELLGLLSLPAGAFQPHCPPCSEGDPQTLQKRAVQKSFCLVRAAIELEDKH